MIAFELILFRICQIIPLMPVLRILLSAIAHPPAAPARDTQERDFCFRYARDATL